MARILVWLCVLGVFLAAPAPVRGLGAEGGPGEGRIEGARAPLIDVTRLEIREGRLDWRRDWWKYSLMSLSGLLSLTLLVYLTKMLLRLLSLLLCIGCGGAGAFLCGRVFLGSLKGFIPEAIAGHVPPQCCLYVLGFVAGYLVGIVLCTMFRKPVQKDRVTVKR